MRCKYCNKYCHNRTEYADKTKLNGTNQDKFIYPICSKFKLMYNRGGGYFFIKYIAVKHNFNYNCIIGDQILTCKICRSRQSDDIRESSGFNNRPRKRV